MKERGILFQAPMVRALLADIKTQTRRIAAPGDFEKPEHIGDGVWTACGPAEPEKYPDALWRERCRYGVPDDRLWVREAWAAPHAFDHLPPRLIPAGTRFHYLADEERGGLRWRPSIHMPRWASRITLDVAGVRVERLGDISDAEAIAEGIQGFAQPRGRPTLWGLPEWVRERRLQRSPREAYFQLLSDIHGDEGPGRNGWLWVIEFKRATP